MIKSTGRTSTFKNNTHAVLSQCPIQPCLEFSRKKSEDQIQSSSNKLRRRLAQSIRTSGLSTEVIVEAHVICESQGRIVDLKKISDESIFLVHKWGNLFENKSESLKLGVSNSWLPWAGLTSEARRSESPCLSLSLSRRPSIGDLIRVPARRIPADRTPPLVGTVAKPVCKMSEYYYK